MREYILIFLSCLVTMNLSSCLSKKSEFVNCYSKEYNSLIVQLLNDFEDHLENIYQKGSYEKNLKAYLRQLENGRNADLIYPTNTLNNVIQSSNILNDIWSNKEINLNGKFVSCLKHSENTFTKDYLERLIVVGDMSPIVIAGGAIYLINTNQTIDEELRIIFMINFYLIWIN